jgi:hypothetical protein
VLDREKAHIYEFGTGTEAGVGERGQATN